MKEIWLPVKDYEGLYVVSNFGQIKRISNSRVLKPDLVDGYCRVSLSKGCKVKKEYVHRVVAKSFIKNEDSLPEVNHKDGKKTNNMVDNLEWCTGEYNTRHAIENNLFNDTNMPKSIYNYNTGEKYTSIKSAAKKFNCSESTIRSWATKHKNGLSFNKPIIDCLYAI